MPISKFTILHKLLIHSSNLLFEVRKVFFFFKCNLTWQLKTTVSSIDHKTTHVVKINRCVLLEPIE